MSGQFAQFALSLVAVIALVACAHWLGFSRGGRIESENEARDLLRLAAGGFEPVQIAVDTLGRSAIGRDIQGRLAVLIPHGGHFVARIAGDDWQISLRDDDLHIASPSLGRAGLQIHLGHMARDWMRWGQVQE